MSRVEANEDNDGEQDDAEEEDGDGIHIQRRVVATATAKSSSTQQDESLVIFSSLSYCILKSMHVLLFPCF